MVPPLEPTGGSEGAGAVPFCQEQVQPGAAEKLTNVVPNGIAAETHVSPAGIACRSAQSGRADGPT
jgi:hypothetical protein